MMLHIHQLVELQDQYANVYERSPTGARGWVRGRREILDNETEVYIEWDKKHWRFAGESDGWSFEHHFRPVNDTLPDSLDAHDSILTADSSPDRCSHCGEIHPPLTSPQEEFLQKLVMAQEAAIDSDAFFIITLRRRELDGLKVYEPEIFSGELEGIAGEMIEAQLIHTAAQLYDAHIVRRVQEMESESGR